MGQQHIHTATDDDVGRVKVAEEVPFIGVGVWVPGWGKSRRGG
jgi:hypothetical protein